MYDKIKRMKLPIKWEFKMQSHKKPRNKSIVLPWFKVWVIVLSWFWTMRKMPGYISAVCIQKGRICILISMSKKSFVSIYLALNLVVQNQVIFSDPFSKNRQIIFDFHLVWHCLITRWRIRWPCFFLHSGHSNKKKHVHKPMF